MRSKPRTAPSSGKASTQRRWASYDDERLLALRFRDLRMRPETSPIWDDVERLYVELARRGIRFRPHVWFSTEWFSPDGIPGIAIPFYLAHPRLRHLEQRMIGEVEGGQRPWRLRILRHEAGHALDSAYGLRRRADWRSMFGAASRPYPNHYFARPNSRNHVLNLGGWYAQSHPTEDFAETFAVWLTPKARWRRDYEGWPALEKLEYVETLMEDIAGRMPRCRDRSVVAPIAGNRRTLREHYTRRKARYEHLDRRYDAWLREVFPAAARGAPPSRRASRFLREAGPELRRSLVRDTLAGPYLVDHVIEMVTIRARQLELVVRGSRRNNRKRAAELLEQVIFDMLYRNRVSYAL